MIPWFRPGAYRLLPLPESELLPPGLDLQPFGLMVMLAVVVGALVADRRARREGLHPRIFGELMGYVLIGGFVLGHVLDAVFYHWDVVVARPVFVLELWNGLSSFGGFVGAWVGGLVWRWHRRLPLLAFADACAFAFPFGWLFGRVGCFLAHDHPGAPTDFVLGVRDYRIHDMAPPWLTRHDLGLYEAMWCVAAIALLLVLGRARRPRGFYLALVPLLYAPVRFGLDFLRATDIPHADSRLFGLTPGHYGAIALFAIGLALAWRVRRGPEAEVPPEATLEAWTRATAT